MIKHTGRQTRESQAAVEKRVHALEGRVTALAEAVRVLAHGLEDLPPLSQEEPASTARSDRRLRGWCQVTFGLPDRDFRL